MWRDESLDPDVTRWLVEDATRGLRDEVAARLSAGDDPLAVGTWVRSREPSPDRASTLTAVAVASRSAWEDGQPVGTLWTPAAAEQASRPEVAAWRASRLAGRRVVDVTAGCGGDALALADVATSVLAVERDAARVPLLSHNLAGRAAVVRGDATRPAWRGVDAWFADPGRRDGGRRLRRLAELHPGVPDLLAVAPAAGVVLPPALHLDDPDLPSDAELEFVQHDGRLVEATLWTHDLVTGHRRASEVGTGATVVGDPADARLPVTGPPVVGEWLVDPAPALVRARLVALVGEDRGWRRLDARRALVVADGPATDGWGRAEQVVATTSARPKAVREVLRGLDDRPVELVLHGVQTDPRRFLNAAGNPPTGPSGHRVHLVRTSDGAVALVTTGAHSEDEHSHGG